MYTKSYSYLRQFNIKTGEKMKLKHILRSQQFDRPALEGLFTKTDEISRIFSNKALRPLLAERQAGKTLLALFYEPSTRTRLSFCTAATFLGMKVSQTENARDFSSAVKGESLEDSIRVLAGYGFDVIVLRHYEDGAANRAAEVIDKYIFPTSIINAGDGRGQHPTQALLDVYTIRKELGKIDGVRVCICGDLANGRTGRSLVYLLSKFNDVSFRFLSPENLRMGDDIKSHLQEHSIPFLETEKFETAFDGAHVVYSTRIQKERGGQSDLDLTINEKTMSLLGPDAILLHPLPRVGEIAKEVDDDRRSAFFRQSDNGLLIRMALLDGLCGEGF